jgi:hypothetical protein
MKTWKYKLIYNTSTLSFGTENVKNWDGMEQTIARNETLRGHLVSLTNVFEFIGDARLFIQNAIDSGGMEAEVYMQIYEGNGSGHSGSFKKYGNPLKACLKTYENTTTILKITFAVSGFEEKLFNRLDTNVRYNITEAIDGEYIGLPAYAGLTMPDRVLSGSAELNIPLQSVKFGQFDSPEARPTGRISLATDILNTAIPKIVDTTQTLFATIIGDPAFPDYLCLLQHVQNTTKLHIKISDLNIRLDPYGVGSLGNPTIYILLQKLGANNNVSQTIASIQMTDGYSGVNFSGGNMSLIGEWDVILQNNESIILSFWFALTRTGSELDYGLIGSVSGGKIELYSESNFDQTTTKCALAHETFERIIAQTTGAKNAFYSNFFGRQNIGYAADGVGAYTALLNGLLIRSFPDDLANLTFNFGELLKNMQNMFNLVGWIKNDKLYLEKFEDAYDLTNFIEITEYGEIKVNLIESDHVTNIKYGYTDQSYEEASGLKSFNLQAERQTFVKSSNNKTDLTVTYRADDIGIELARRLDYRHNPKLDYRADADNFVIICKKNTSGVIVKLASDYGTITGVDSPNTAYNVGITPLSILKRWYNVISNGLYLYPQKAIKFVSGAKNTNLKINGEAETKTILVSELTPPLFLPFALNVSDALITSDQFKFIIANPTTLLKIGYFYGIIDTAKIDMNTNKAELKLIRANR